MWTESAKENIRVFAASLLLSLFFWTGINAFDSATYAILSWKILEQNPQVLTAQLHTQQLEKTLAKELPLRVPHTEDPEIKAKAVAISFLSLQGEEKLLFGHQENTPLPIASISKLMTALVAKASFSEDDIIEIQQPLYGSGFGGRFRVGTSFTAKNLLQSLLIESNNDVAVYFAQEIGEEEFVNQMNQTALKLGFEQMIFSNPTGLDPEQGKAINRASAKETASLMAYLIYNHPDIFSILSIQEFRLHTTNAQYHHTVKNTNQLLEYDKWPTRVLGGKTGTTTMAGECLVLVLKAPKNKGYVIITLLGSNNRFEEASSLVEWVYKSYRW